MNSKYKIGSGVVLGLASLLGFGSTADATLYSFPGTNCVDGNSLIEYSGEAVNGDATVDATFYCPMLRVGLTTTAISSIVVAVRDGNDAESVSCFARSCGPISGCSNSSTVSSGTTFTGTTSLSLGSVSGFSNGMVQLQCTVPDEDVGQSGVISYRWDD